MNDDWDGADYENLFAGPDDDDIERLYESDDGLASRSAIAAQPIELGWKLPEINF